MEGDASGPEETESESSLEEILETLTRTAKGMEISLFEARVQMRMVQKKVSAEVALQPRAKVRTWLEKRGRPVTADIEEFFEWLLEEHAQDDRLDVSARSIILNADAQHLFGLGKQPIAFLDLLEHLPKVYS